MLTTTTPASPPSPAEPTAPAFTAALQAPALTLHRPWPACITDLPEPVAKRRENRTWTEGYRGPVWLHAGGRWDDTCARTFTRVARHGQLAGTPEAQTMADGWSWNRDDHPTGLVALVDLVDVCSRSRFAERLLCDCGPWAMPGQRHLLLANIRKLPTAVPCRGYQRFWRPPADAATTALAQLAAPAYRGVTG